MAEGDNAGKSLARLTQDGLAESSPVAADLISFGVGSDVLRSLGQINKGLAFNNIAEDSRFVGL